MLKEKRYIEGEKLSAIVMGHDFENLRISSVENKMELESLIEELTQLRNAIETTPNVKTASVTKKQTETKVKENDSEEEVKATVKTKEKTKNKEKTKGEKKVKKQELPDEIKMELEEKFPNKKINISELRINHLSLYSKVTRFAKQKGISPKDLLKKNGFEYLRKERNSAPKWTEEEYQGVLAEKYPDKEIVAKEFRTEEDGALYNVALSYGRKQEMNIEQYLESLGYEYVKRKVNAE